MKKGFTLIELLAVIVILAIIAIIAVPIILNIIKTSQEKADIRSAEMYLKAVSLAVADNNLKKESNPTTCEVLDEGTNGYKAGDLYCDNSMYIKVKVDNPSKSGTIIFENGKIVTVIGLKINNSTFDFSNGNLELLKEYIVTFDSNGGSNVESQSVLKNRTANVPDNPTREGYIFKGWQLNNQDFDFNTSITQDITLKAIWISTLTSGQDFNSKLKTLANGSSKTYDYQDTKVKSISFYSNGNLPEGYTKEQLNLLSSIDVSSDNNGTIKAYWDGKEKIYVYSDDQIAMNSSTGTTSSGYYTFYYFAGMQTIDVSQIDTSNMKSMESMFQYCYNLTSADLRAFDTSNVITMYRLFHTCRKLESVDLSTFVTTNLEIMSSMFNECQKLTTIILPNFDAPKLRSMAYTFYHCTNLATLDLRNINLSGVTNRNSTFVNVPTSVTIYLKDTEANRNFMSTNFPSYQPTYITPPEEIQE